MLKGAGVRSRVSDSHYCGGLTPAPSHFCLRITDSTTCLLMQSPDT